MLPSKLNEHARQKCEITHRYARWFEVERKIYSRRCHEILVTKLFRQNNRNNVPSFSPLRHYQILKRNTPPSPFLSPASLDRKPIKHPIRTPNLPNNPNSNSVPRARCLRLPFYYFLRPRENAIGIACNNPRFGAAIETPLPIDGWAKRQQFRAIQGPRNSKYIEVIPRQRRDVCRPDELFAGKGVPGCWNGIAGYSIWF